MIYHYIQLAILKMEIKNIFIILNNKKMNIIIILKKKIIIKKCKIKEFISKIN